MAGTRSGAMAHAALPRGPRSRRTLGTVAHALARGAAEPAEAGADILVEPGTAAELPVIVAGGIAQEPVPLCISAGAQSLVVGRVLLTSVERRP